MLFVYISLSMATVRAEAPIFKNGESLLLSAPKVVLSIGFHKMKISYDKIYDNKDNGPETLIF